MERQNPLPETMSRVTRSKEDARRSYDRMSAWYDLLTGSEWRYIETGLARLSPLSGENVLEIGYGTGRALAILARLVGPTGMVYGVDLSPRMRAVAQQRLERMGLSARVQLATHDACGLPFDACQMDAAFMSFTLELFDTPEIPVVLGECKRVLAEHGRLGVVAMGAEQSPGIALWIYERAHRLFPRFVDCRPIDAATCLEAAGFRIQSARRFYAWGLPLDICLATK